MTDGRAPLLTVVTVVKNDPAGLRRTRCSLDNAVKSDRTLSSKLEWIVIDGSEPASPPEPLAGVRSRWLQEPPHGIFEAMNKGLREAVGSWIYFLNAGDQVVEPAALRQLFAVLEETNASWGFARVRFLDTRGGALNEPSWSYQEHRQAMFSRGHFPPHQGTVVRTHALRSLNGFDTRFRITADYHALLKLARDSDPTIWPWTLAEFQQGGTSTTQWQQALREMHRARREIFQPRGKSAFTEYLHSTNQWLRSFVAHVPVRVRT